MCNTTSSNGRVSLLILSQVQCEFCSKFFVNKSVLKKHINAIHKNIYFFKCSYPNCTRTFRTGYRLYVHELFHVSSYSNSNRVVLSPSHVNSVEKDLLRKER